MEEIQDSLISAAKSVENTDVCVRDLGLMKNWWQFLKPYVKCALLLYSEVVLLDPREEAGKELIDAITKSHEEVTSFELFSNGIIAVFVNEDNAVGKIEVLLASVEQKDQYDSMQAENNGILRING